jgi:hypothetical protein
MTAGRPKGRRFVSFSVSLPDEQILWLNSQPNASETVRNLIGKEMNAQTETVTPESVRAKRVNTLNEKLRIATLKRATLLRGNERHFKGCEQREQRGTDHDGNPYYYDPRYVVENEADPTPTDEQGEIAKAQLEALDAEINQLNRDIDQALHQPKVDEPFGNNPYEGVT